MQQDPGIFAVHLLEHCSADSFLSEVSAVVPLLLQVPAERSRGLTEADSFLPMFGCAKEKPN